MSTGSWRWHLLEIVSSESSVAVFKRSNAVSQGDSKTQYSIRVSHVGLTGSMGVMERSYNLRGEAIDKGTTSVAVQNP